MGRLKNGRVDDLLDQLARYRAERVFNPYGEVDPGLDRPRAARIRRENLRRYLEAFVGARYVLVGEAPGYAGCRFSGIPFTCEAQWAGAEPLGWTVGRGLRRSSAAETPWSERSARMVWEALEGRRDCLLWNAFPWHPVGERGALSNRPPGRDMEDGLAVLRGFLALFPTAQPYAVGRVAQRALGKMGIDAPYIRHPSHGGKRQFLAGVAALA